MALASQSSNKADNTGLRSTVGQALISARKAFWGVGIFSIFVNALMLTGPIYMLQVYDRVLGSRSIETLIALSILVLFLYGIMGLMDYARGRIMGRVAARFQSRLDRRVFDAVIRKSAVSPDDSTATDLGGESLCFECTPHPGFYSSYFLFTGWQRLHSC